jgi:hypothetical protein
VRGIELEYPQDAEAIQQLYQKVQGLLSHLAPDPLTVARVTGVLLVYQLPGTDREEVKWFEAELQNSSDLESLPSTRAKRVRGARRFNLPL